MKVMVVGTKESMKYKAANRIIRCNAFKAPKPKGTWSKKETNRVDGRQFTAIISPYIFGQNPNINQLKTWAAPCIKLANPGPQAYVLVIKVGKVLENNEKNAMSMISRVFGPDAPCRTIVIFTSHGASEKAIEDYKASPYISRILNACGDRSYTFDLSDEHPDDEASELTDMIDELTEKNKRR